MSDLAKILAVVAVAAFVAGALVVAVVFFR